MLTIEPLTLPAPDADIHALAELLIDAVNSGAAVTFLPPLDRERANAWWRATLTNLHPRAVVLVARDAGAIVGTAHFQPATAFNQLHRAEVVKVIVHRCARGRGIGRRLMIEIERCARAAGFTLLTLDTKQGDAAERLYRSLGWTVAGSIPGYAFNADGTTLHEAVFFYKHIHASDDAAPDAPRTPAPVLQSPP